MNNSALLWGATGGIGRALVDLLKQNGWTVVAVGRKLDALQGSADHLVEVELSQPSSVERAVSEISQYTPQVDWWVYAAGDILSQPVKTHTVQDWQRIMDANLNGVFYAAHFSAPLLTEQAPLYILGAVNERMRLPGLAAYAVAKAGVEALGEVLRKELRRPVVVVRPAAVDTPLWQKVPFKMPANAMTPQALAEKLLEVYQQGYRENLLDL